MTVSRAWLVCLSVTLVTFAGCLGADTTQDAQLPVSLPEPATLSLNGTMAFATNVVSALHYGIGLYEPTIDVSDSGIIYISAHTAGVATTGAPAYYSDDDGKTWKQLPFAGPASAPNQVHGGTPPPSDEIFIVAADDGTAWGVDILLGAYPLHGWCDDGQAYCYYNPNAYSRTDTTCHAESLNDRPWAAYANGTLLMVNNPGGGPVQVAAMQVPPSEPVGVANPVTGPQWNMCAGSGGFIPGIPDIRDDGFFVVPQRQGSKYVVITGNAADVMDVKETTVFEATNAAASEIGLYGQAVFDADGTMYVAAMNNTANTAGPGAGGIKLAVSTDDGATFTEHRYVFDKPVSSIYLDGNKHGAGGLINWGLVDGERTDWYMGHLAVDPDRKPIIREASVAVEDGPHASRHVQGAALGPDGRAYMIMSEVSGNDRQESAEQAGTTPMRVVVQTGGPKVPLLHPGP